MTSHREWRPWVAPERMEYRSREYVALDVVTKAITDLHETNYLHGMKCGDYAEALRDLRQAVKGP